MGTHYSPKLVTTNLGMHLDASNSRSCQSGWSTWIDISGSYNNAAFSGVAYSASEGGILVFNGIQSILSVSLTKAASCTFCCWAKTTTVSTQPMLFNCSLFGGGQALSFSGGISWYGNQFSTIPASVTDGNWHYYVVVIDAASTIKLFYDNALLGSVPYSTWINPLGLTIGGPGVFGNKWNGSMSMFSYYSRALTINEIAQNFYARKSRYGI